VIKPSQCNGCPLIKLSTGFCPDLVPISPKVAIVLKMATKDEVINGVAMSGKAGWFWWKEFIYPAGFKREDVLVANVLRCYPHSGDFPIGAMKKQAVAACRRWDFAIEAFRPTVAITTFNPAKVYQSPQLGKFVRRTMEKAKGFVEAGERPLVLMGEEAREKYAPWLAGQMKKWNGHWWRLDENRS